MKFHEILALHFFDAGDGAGAGERIAVGVARPVQKSREHAQAHLDGRGLFALDGGELQLLLLFEVVFRENGIQNEVGKQFERGIEFGLQDRKSTRLNSSHEWISYAVFCLKKKKIKISLK